MLPNERRGTRRVNHQVDDVERIEGQRRQNDARADTLNVTNDIGERIYQIIG